MSMACETGEDASVPCPDLPVPPAPAIEEPRPLRLTVPLLLAAGWGALLTFSLTFLVEDGRVQGAAAGPAAVAGLPDAERVPAARPQWRQAGAAVPAAETAAIVRTASLSPEPPPAAPARAAGPPVERAAYVGTWGPTAQACGATSRRRGYLPALITEDGAKAGRTLCRFRNGRRDGIAWSVAADCSERGRNWTSQVRLLVDGDRLIWTSAKGSSSYVRCGRRDG